MSQDTDNEQNRLEQAADILSQLPRKPRSLKAQVEYLHTAIMDALDKGYSYAEVSTMLAAQSITIPIRTLKQYVHAQKRHNLAMEEEAPAIRSERSETITAPKATTPKADKQQGFVEIPPEL